MRKFRFLALIILILITLLMFFNRWPAIDMALFLYWSGLDGLLILLALYNWLSQIGAADKRKHVIRGALMGLLAAGILTACLTIYLQPLIVSSKSGWFALLAASFLLSLGLQRRFGQGKAVWRQRVSLKAASALSTGNISLLTGVAFMTTLRDGVEAGLYVPALLTYIKPAALAGGCALGVVLLIAALWTVPRLPHKQLVRYLALTVPLLTIFLCVRFIGIGILSLQDAGWLRSTPAVMLSFHTTWEEVFLQIGLLGTLLLAVARNRKRNKEFSRQINM
ncbi:MAG: hypothetical protein K6T85_18225 [Gorillibacterium sp.]|nr:hypothetical protein [Gorillibacterium sp.]